MNKKSVRAAEDVVSKAKDEIVRLKEDMHKQQMQRVTQQQRIAELEQLLQSTRNSLKEEQNKNKKAAIKEHYKQVRCLQKKQVQLQSSVDTWTKRFDHTLQVSSFV